MTLRHVWFDLDGTLIDSAPAILDSFELAFRSVGVKPVRPIVTDVIGPPLRATLELLAGSLDKKLIDSLSLAFMKSYDSIGYQQTQVFEGVHELLQEVRDYGLELAVATNKRIHPTRLILEYLGWSSYFSKVVSLDSFAPHLESKNIMLRRLLVDSAVDLRSVIYVGDRLEDGVAASCNGLAFVAATWGYGAILQDELRPEWFLVSSPAQLSEFLRDS